MEKVKIKVFDKKAGHFIIPWEGEGYDEFDLTYADGNWYITGGEKLTEEKYEVYITHKVM